jgi:hypothetical protein
VRVSAGPSLRWAQRAEATAIDIQDEEFLAPSFFISFLRCLNLIFFGLMAERQILFDAIDICWPDEPRLSQRTPAVGTLALK